MTENPRGMDNVSLSRQINYTYNDTELKFLQVPT
jgi:hypothetical protein